MPLLIHRFFASAPALAALIALTAALTGCQGTPKVAPALQQQAYSDAPYARVLAASVREGLVDYPAIRLPAAPDGIAKRDRAAADPDALDVQLNIYLDAIARFGPDSTPDQFPTEADRFAYHLNAYNAIMLRRWLNAGARTAKPTDKVGVLTWFTLDRWTLDGRKTTLNALEQKLIRPVYDDYRAHAALICGAIACPPLRHEPFRGPQLEAQLDDQMVQWLNNPQEQGVTVAPDGTVTLAAIFKWYREDFASTGGLKAAVDKYLDNSDPRKPAILQAIDQDRIVFPAYDWSINLAPSQTP